jgi:hypothetical protein
MKKSSNVVIALLLITISSVLILLKQEYFLISGNIIFQGLYNEKTLQLFALIAALLVTPLAVIFCNSGRNSVGLLDRIKNDNSVPPDYFSGRYSSYVIVKSAFYSAVFSLLIIIISNSLSNERWAYDGSEVEQVYYFFILVIIFFLSYLSTRSVFKSAFFPSLIFFLYANQVVGSGGGLVSSFSVSPDSYHSGEYYIPARLVAESIWGLFDEYNPSRGLTNYYPALVALLIDDPMNFERLSFYELTVVRFTLLTISFFLLVGINFYARTLIIIFIGSFLVGGILSAVALMIPATWFICQNINFFKPIKTMTILVGTSLFLTFHSAGEGVLWNIVVLLVFVPKIFENRSIISKYSIHTYVMLALSVIFYFTVIMFFSPKLISYVSGNGSINIAAHSIYNLLDFTKKIALAKYGFLYLAAILSLIMVYSVKQGHRKETDFALIALGLVILGILRFMGRDDTGSLSRPFAATLLISTAILVLVLHLGRSSRGLSRISLLSLCTIIFVSFSFSSQITLTKILAFFSSEPLIFNKALPGNISASLKSVDTFYEKYAGNCSSLVDLTGNNSILALSKRLSFIPTTSSYNAVSRSEQKAIIETIQKYETLGGACIRIMHQNIDHDGGGLLLRAPLLGRYIMSLDLVDVDEDLPTTGVWVRTARKENGKYLGESNTYEEERALINYFDMFSNLQWLPLSWGMSRTSTPSIEPLGAQSITVPNRLRRTLTLALFIREQYLVEPESCVLTMKTSDGRETQLSFRSDRSGTYTVPLYAKSQWYLWDVETISWSCTDLIFAGFESFGYN